MDIDSMSYEKSLKRDLNKWAWFQKTYSLNKETTGSSDKYKRSFFCLKQINKLQLKYPFTKTKNKAAITTSYNNMKTIA